MMKELIEILAAPFAASLVLAGIHAYLGIHVLERGVIFVDLALAQVAGLGASVAFVLGYGHHGAIAYLFALGFTIAAGLFFSLTRPRRGKIPQEAVIGIFYVVSAAAMILLMDKAPQGAEHIKDMLVGNILVVSWPQILKTLLLYSAIGLFHLVFRREFFAVSSGATQVLGKDIPVAFWDFLFYVSFGVVVTSSVSIAGVLLVFSYLIVPSVSAALFADRVLPRLLIAWAVGVVVSVLGVAASYYFDAPTGAAIVCTFGVVLALLSVVQRMIRI